MTMPKKIAILFLIAVSCYLIIQGGDLMFRKTKLEVILENWERNGGDLSDALDELTGFIWVGNAVKGRKEYPIKKKRDAQAIIRALSSPRLKNASKGEEYFNTLYSMIDLFEEVEGEEAFDELLQNGLPILRKILKENWAGDSEATDVVRQILSVLVIFRQVEDVPVIVEAVKQPIDPDGYWGSFFGAIDQHHPAWQPICDLFKESMPVDNISISFLERVVELTKDASLTEHPFNSKAGYEIMKRWLENPDKDMFPEAHASAQSLPYIDEPWRSELISIALKHHDHNVRVAASWAEAMIGRQAGLDRLADYCMDVNYSDYAIELLNELGRTDIITKEAFEPDFQAMAEFSQWLAHPLELGVPPDKLEIIDKRRLAWPPEFKEKPFWVIRYTLHDKTGEGKDDIGVGLVGSSTWCFFDDEMIDFSPEDVYAKHCFWEMENKGLIETIKGGDLAEHQNVLQNWHGEKPDDIKIILTINISDELKFQQKKVALATATLGGEAGLLLLDGERSRWYGASEVSEDVDPDTILERHVGRGVLGFTNPHR